MDSILFFPMPITKLQKNEIEVADYNECHRHPRVLLIWISNKIEVSIAPSEERQFEC